MRLTTFFSNFMLLAVAFGYNGTATHYSIAQGGRPACCPEDYQRNGNEKGGDNDKACKEKFEVGKYCGAPTDGADFWTGNKCMCSGDDPKCTNGKCDGCCDKSDCTSGCPTCLVNGKPDPNGMCGKRLKITCIDPDPRVCKKPGACVVIEITNVCPMYNPCNWCKDAGKCKDK